MDEKRVRSVPLFAGLSKKGSRALAQQADEIDMPEGKQLAREGDFAFEFFVITEGTAEVTHDGEHVASLGPGDFFGEIGIVAAERRTADVVATSPLSLIVLTDRAFRSLKRESPSVCELIRAAIDERYSAAG
jgi:CRP-like cAMP-binding protein